MFLSIKSKVLLSHFISVLAIGMLLGASGYLYISEHVDSDETEHVDIIAKLMRLRLIEAIDRKKSIIQNILNGKEIDFYIEKYHEPVLVQFFSRYSKDFPILGYVNAQTSEEVRVVRGKVSSADKGISQLAAGTLQPDKIFISNVQYDVDLGVPAITFTIPKYSFFGDHLIGFLYGVSPVSDITNVLSDIELAESGFILLLDDKKNIIYPDSKHKTIGKLIEKTANSYQTAIKPTPVVKGVSRALVFGMDSIAAYTTVEETNWALMVVTPYAILTSEANKTLYSSAIILIIILTVSSVIFIIVTNNITNNIINPLRRFVTFTDMLSRGDYSQITGINTKDEIGVLAKSFNNMLVELDRTRHSRNSHLNELLKANEHLKQSQAQLVQSEKMASLGQLVAGVAHEINTPVGIAYTLSSSIEKDTDTIMSAFNDKSLHKSQLEDYIAGMKKSSSLIFNNLHRTAELIQSFKMLARDQLTQERRSFRLKDYIGEILLSLQPKLKKYQHNIVVSCPEDLDVDSYPGAFAQVITNLLMNSILHAYGPDDKGTISIEAIAKNNEVNIEYKDNGKGIPKENLRRIFDPFFTTRRGDGGMGLGLHIVFNIVTQTLGGHIECKSTEGEGTAFIISFPVRAERAA